MAAHTSASGARIKAANFSVVCSVIFDSPLDCAKFVDLCMQDFNGKNRVEDLAGNNRAI